MRKRPEYQMRPVEIAEKAWNRGCIKAFELARIAAWKSAKSVAGITVNDPEEIEACTRAAMAVIGPWRGKEATALCTDAEWDDWQQTANRAIGWVDRRRGTASGLLSLKGVEYPMATAILDILDPDVWPVLDKWAAMTVFGEIPSRYCAARYAAYARHLITEGTRHWNADLSIHGLDEKAQFASMKSGRLPVGWRTTEPPVRVREHRGFPLFGADQDDLYSLPHLCPDDAGRAESAIRAPRPGCDITQDGHPSGSGRSG